MRSYYENIFSQTREKEENCFITYVILEKNWIYYDLLKINKHKNPGLKILVKIIKLTCQIICKSRNSQLEDSTETKIIKFHLVY